MTISLSPINPLVPIGNNIVMTATGAASVTWSGGGSGVVVRGSGLTATCVIGSTATPGAAVTVTATDTATGLLATQTIIVAPQAAWGAYNILVLSGTSTIDVGSITLLSYTFGPTTFNEISATTHLGATPGVITNTVLSDLNPTQQIPPTGGGATFVSCYVLNLTRLPSWGPSQGAAKHHR